MDEFYNLIDEIGLDNPYFVEICDLFICERGNYAEQLKWEYEQNKHIQDESLS
jgi:hypothetical protein